MPPYIYEALPETRKSAEEASDEDSASTSEPVAKTARQLLSLFDAHISFTYL
jgi:hypothetical protein